MGVGSGGGVAEGGGAGVGVGVGRSATVTVTVSGEIAAIDTADGRSGTTGTSSCPGPRSADVDRDHDRRAREAVEVGRRAEQGEQDDAVRHLVQQVRLATVEAQAGGVGAGLGDRARCATVTLAVPRRR